MTKREALPPPMLPSPGLSFQQEGSAAFHYRSEAEDLHARLAQVEAQIAKKQGKVDQRSASLQALVREQC